MRIARYLQKKRVIWQFKRKKVVYGEGLIINGRIITSKQINLKLGKNVRINSGFINPVGSEIRTSFTTYGEGKIIIGNNVGISNSTLYSSKGIFIEDDVMVGGGCRIYDTDFHPLYYQERMENIQGATPKKEVYIRKGAFIGGHSIILKGVEIGEKSIVGAGSVVTKSIPAGEIWAGNPARFIRRI